MIMGMEYWSKRVYSVFGITVVLGCLCLVLPPTTNAQVDELNGVFSEVLKDPVLAGQAHQADGEGPSGQAAEPSPDGVRIATKRLTDYNIPGLDKKLTYQSSPNAEIVETIYSLIHFASLKNNIVVSKGVSGITARFKFEEVPAGEALEIFLAVNQLAYKVTGDIITIMSDEEYKQQIGSSFYDNRQVKILKLKYADAARVSTMLGSVKSEIGTIVGDPVTGNLILVDTMAKIKEMEAIIRKADIDTVSRVLPTVTEHFLLRYANIEEIQSELTAVLTKEAGAVQVNDRTKTVIVTDLPHNMPKIRNLIELFDARPRQVFVEAKIVEIGLNDTFSLGINWNHFFEGLDPRFSLNSVSLPGSIASPVGTLTYNTILANGDLQAVLTALKQVGEVKIISNPQIAVADGKEATIQVVERQPYKIVGLETGTTNVTEVSYQFVDIGVQLSVLPRINDDKFINIDIKPEISSISQWYDGPPQEGTPVVKTANAQTTVLVKDGVTIIIGGLIRDREEKTTSTVPFLGSVPLLGRAFRHDNVSVVNTETVVFMTPRIISGEESFLRMTDMKKKSKPLRTEGGGKRLKPIR